MYHNLSGTFLELLKGLLIKKEYLEICISNMMQTF